MRAQPELRRDLVLVGGGHSHALALRMLAMRPVQGLRITLVSPHSHTPYSGMLPGLIAGHYTFDETHIDLARLCQWAGARFVQAEATALHPARRRVSLAGRPDLAYDVVSLDIGSLPDLDSVPGAREHCVPVKPVSGLWRRWRQLEQRLRAGAALRVGVVGGGAGSVELALAMAQRLGRERVRLRLYTAAEQVLPGYNRRARRAVQAALAAAGIEVHTAARVTAVGERGVTLQGGREDALDQVFWCTAAAPAPWIAASGLPTDAGGFLAVRDTLQSSADARVFAAGDIATQLNHPRPKAGVFAVRQAPVLAHNLRAFMLDEPLREHRPQRRFLSLLSLGERCATAERGVFSATGAWVWRWKDRIDRSFMRRFSALPSAMPAATRRLPELPTQAQVACGGCGAKVGADPLRQVLEELAARFPRHCSGGGDDAAPLAGLQGATLLQSIDVLRQLVADPWTMGRIAANHALSDLYACGARPLGALAAATLPYAGPRILQRDLYQLLAGALHELAAADCPLLGGHSMQGADLSLGFAVSGVPMDAQGRLLGKSGAQPGDALLLTGALGTGALFAAHMQLRADGRDIDAAVDNMLRGNAAAARLALQYGASACTDVTGFGLLGHLLEMLGDERGARLVCARVPALAGARDCLEAGIISTMHPANQERARAALGASVDSPAAQLLFDPQTSGPLLLAVPAARAQELLGALLESGYPEAAIIGEISAAPAAGVSPVLLA